VILTNSQRLGDPEDGLERVGKVCGGEVCRREFGENWGNRIRRGRRGWSGDRMIGEDIWRRGIVSLFAG